MTSPPSNDVQIVRDCGDCALCCKVMHVQALEKPAGTWCTHCKFTEGCAIHASKPQECTDFYCGYLMMPNLDERWKPSTSKLVLVAAPDETRMTIFVDPQRPDAWRQEPYHSRLRFWAKQAAAENAKVIVMIGKRVFVILPDKDVDLGVMDEDDRIVTERIRTPAGIVFDAMKLHKDDPRAAGTGATKPANPAI